MQCGGRDAVGGWRAVPSSPICQPGGQSRLALQINSKVHSQLDPKSAKGHSYLILHETLSQIHYLPQGMPKVPGHTRAHTCMRACAPFKHANMHEHAHVRLQNGEASLDDSAPARELSKVSIICYSPTGHMLALVGGTSGREVLVYSALHRSLLARLTGHYSPVQVSLMLVGWGLRKGMKCSCTACCTALCWEA
eukprot:1150037-Pelagomonas_calceolata.AAC.3